MGGAQSISQTTSAWWQFFDYCFNVDPASTICQPFWDKAIGTFIVFGFVLVAYGVWKIWDYRRKYAAALRAQWLREQVDEVGIKEAQWAADKVYEPDVPDDELLERIRAGLAARKREASQAPRTEELPRREGSSTTSRSSG